MKVLINKYVLLHAFKVANVMKFRDVVEMTLIKREREQFFLSFMLLYRNCMIRMNQSGNITYLVFSVEGVCEPKDQQKECATR